MLPHDTTTTDVSSGAAPAARQTLPPGLVIEARYEIVRLLGIGGFAHVYEANDLTLRRRIAIKLLRDDRLSPTALKRFRREVALAQLVTSPHIVRVFDIGESEGQTFLTMELVEGETLRERLEGGPLPITDALDVAESVLKALHELHTLGIVHRDVKPSNVLIDREGRVKLADLGLARALTSDETRATQNEGILGTYEYLSPEQALGKDCDERSDLYSFGVMLYECLTGTLPFGERGSLGAVLAHVKEKPTPVRKTRPEVPRWLAGIVARLLEKSPLRRIRSATGVLRALERQRAPFDPVPFLRRVAVLSLVLVAAGFFWQSRQREISRLVRLGKGIAAVDADDRRLWTREPVDERSAVLVTLPGGRRAVAALDTPSAHSPRLGREELLILDGKSGDVIARYAMPNLIVFTNFADEFGRPAITVTDIDHDGTSEVVVTYSHHYYPSATVLWDGAASEARLVLAASGHHHLFGTADVTGDGRDELLFSGVNNLLGWNTAVAAVDVLPTTRQISTYAGVLTPDVGGNTSMATGAGMVWYALAPPGFPQAQVVEGTREIQLRYASGQTIRLGFDGFRTGSQSTLAPEERQRARRECYESLRNAETLRLAGNGDALLVEAERAVKLATAAADDSLLEWASRVHARSFIVAGRYEAAERAFERLVSKSPSASDVAFDAAHQYHLSGRLDDAVRWYRRAYLAPENFLGRLNYESVEGAVLARVEQRRFDEASHTLDEFARMQTNLPLDLYRSFIAWRRGTLDGSTTIGHMNTDLSRYWELEFAYALQPDDPALLARVQSELKRKGLHEGLFKSLEGQLLLDGGRNAEALTAIRAASAWVDRSRPSDVTARAHADLIEERLTRIERAAAR